MARRAVVDKDLGFKKVMREIAQLSTRYVVSGIQEQAVTESVAKQKRVQKAGASIAQYAGYNEFGTSKIPQRSFLRTAFDENLAVIENYSISQYDKVVSGEQTANTALQKIGTLLQTAIKRQIDKITTPPNAPATIKKKKSSKPLFDFGSMRQAVTYALRKNNP